MYKLRPIYYALIIRMICVTFAGLGGAYTVAAPTTAQKISDSDYRISAPECHLQLDVNPAIGGRIAGLKFNNKEIVTHYACAADTYDPRSACNGSGSTFWTSPQRAWPLASWPPVASVDGNPYSIKIRRKHLLMSSSSNDALGASIDKDISINDSTCAINLRYVINASRTVTLAPWEITRVPRGGIAFFPLGDAQHFTAGPQAAHITQIQDIVWFDDTGMENIGAGGAKLIADGKDGWLAYAADGHLFLKKFADVAVDKIAPDEGDVEIFAGKDFLELEAQGGYATLKEYGQLPWTVEWRVIKIPKSVKVKVGSESLLKFVRDQLSSRH